MAKINDNYLKLPGSYLFSEIARRVSAYSQRGLKRELIRLGIGDVTRPLAPAVTAAMPCSGGRDGHSGRVSRLWAGTGV